MKQVLNHGCHLPAVSLEGVYITFGGKKEDPLANSNDAINGKKAILEG